MNILKSCINSKCSKFNEHTKMIFRTNLTDRSHNIILNKNSYISRGCSLSMSFKLRI